MPLAPKAVWLKNHSKSALPRAHQFPFLGKWQDYTNGTPLYILSEKAVNKNSVIERT